jgi:hypothetical protein
MHNLGGQLPIKHISITLLLDFMHRKKRSKTDASSGIHNA